MAVFISFMLFALINITPLNAQKVPALYVFGDSLVDVGNNNYIALSIQKANYPHNGIDYPDGEATGRFSNGKNAADFIAEKVGLPSSPPYLSNEEDVYLEGASFASGGAGILDSTGQGFLRKCIPLKQQVDYYGAVHSRVVSQLGADDARSHLSNSLYVVVIGSNDLRGYFKSDDQNTDPQQYVDELISTLQGVFKKLHGLGARKFHVTGVGPIGCTPDSRFESSDEECVAEMNELAGNYNKALTKMIKGLSVELSGFSYSFFDLYNGLMKLINNPEQYGFAEAKGACCGLGKLNAATYCLPVSSYCPNRKDHIFWDKVHPTEATSRIVVDMMFKNSAPMNLKELIAL